MMRIAAFGLAVALFGASPALAQADPGAASVRGEAAARDGSVRYVVDTSAGAVRVLDAASGERLRAFRVLGRPVSIVVANDGRDLWIGEDGEPRVQVIDAQSGARRMVLPVAPLPLHLAVSPDGATVASSNSETGSVTLFDAALRRPIRTIGISNDGCAGQGAIRFSPDGAVLRVEERGAAARLDLATGDVTRRAVPVVSAPPPCGAPAAESRR